MQLGFVTYYDPDLIAFAGEAGFDCLEVFCDMDTVLDLRTMTGEDIRMRVQEMEKNGLRFGTIAVCPNHLVGDAARRKENNAYFVRGLQSARAFGINIVMTNAWADPEKSPAENIKTFKAVFTEYAKVAEGEGVRIAIENCPHHLGYPKHIGNISFSPEMWSAMFDAVPSKALGLEFDPSHLVWQGIDYLWALKTYGERVYAVHAKDTEILKEKQNLYGILGRQFGANSEWDAGWWRYRIPGWGQVDWRGMLSILCDLAYEGPLIIEHEDPVFDGPRRKEGLKMGLNYLRSFGL